jgi:hypothetical protein
MLSVIEKRLVKLSPQAAGLSARRAPLKQKQLVVVRAAFVKPDFNDKNSQFKLLENMLE